MKLRPGREWLPLAWTAVPVALPLLLASVVVHLNGLRGRVDTLERELATKREALEALEIPIEERAALEARCAQLAEWSEMTASDSLRVEELSRIAWNAGVALRSLRSRGAEAPDDGGVVACSHEVTAVGTYRCLAAFLDGVYGARGMAAVGNLAIQPDETPGGDLLRATLRVTWNAKAAAPEAAATLAAAQGALR